MKNRIYGYARVSTKGQSLDRQIKYLRDYGIEERNIITDTCTGVNFRRTGYNALSKVLLKKGDTFFLPAGIGNVKVQGECKFIVANV